MCKKDAVNLCRSRSASSSRCKNKTIFDTYSSLPRNFVDNFIFLKKMLKTLGFYKLML